MEPKEIKITPPEGYIIDTENSTFECIKFKKKELTYEDITKYLHRYKKDYSYIAGRCILTSNNGTYVKASSNVTISEKQLEKLLAINKLMNVAVFLNDGWKPDWNIWSNLKYFIVIVDNNICVDYTCDYNSQAVYFKSEEHARQAIDILGEETIRLALSTDW